MKQTALDWLLEQMSKEGMLPKLEDYHKAKQMQRNQIIDAWEDGAQTEHRAIVNGKSDSNSFRYYKETYEQIKQK